VLIAGRGAQQAHASLVRLAEHYGLGVYTAFRRQDAFPNSHPNYLGHLTLGADPAILEPLRRADLVVAAGTRLDQVTTQSYTLPRQGARVIAVGDAEDVPGANPPIRAGVRELAEAVLDCAGPVVPRALTASHEAYLRASTPGEAQASTPGTLHPAQVLVAMHRALPADAVLTNDAGNFSIFCHRYWRFEYPASQLGPASGAMGYAVPAAVAAALAAPDRRVVGLAGDGGFLMTGHELETAARHRLPVTVLVFANRCFGTIAAHQIRGGFSTSGVDIGAVDIAGYARALGAEGRDIRDPAELEAALAAPVARPTVLAVHTDPDVLAPGLTRSRAAAA
jgi:acetolactate synthase-1/2/3 large subunit